MREANKNGNKKQVYVCGNFVDSLQSFCRRTFCTKEKLDEHWTNKHSGWRCYFGCDGNYALSDRVNLFVHVRSDHDSELAAAVERLNLTVHPQEPQSQAADSEEQADQNAHDVEDDAQSSSSDEEGSEVESVAGAQETISDEGTDPEKAVGMVAQTVAECTDSSEDTESSGDDGSETSLAAATGADAGSPSRDDDEHPSEFAQNEFKFAPITR